MEQFKSGTYINQGYYKSFQPEFINREWQLNDMTVLQLLSQADRHLGRLDMYSEYVNIEMFIQMHIAKEATQSSKIEGTQTNIEDTFLEEKDFTNKKILPFCTHEGSGLGKSESDIKKLTSGAEVLKGLAIHGSEVNNSEKQIKKWLEDSLR